MVLVDGAYDTYHDPICFALTTSIPASRWPTTPPRDLRVTRGPGGTPYESAFCWPGDVGGMVRLLATLDDQSRALGGEAVIGR